ncbi:MAG TPA: hypothetical protein ENG95_01260, partial [Nitrospirae bacterium]|nr:hypothetical protein [Nitrospirota bacterium]
MLKIMRSHKFFTVFLLGFLTIALTIVFIFWGVGPQQNPSAAVVARVNKKRITLPEYQRAYEKAYKRAREIYKNDEEIEKLNLRTRVLDELIDRRVLLDAAADAGVRATEKDIQEIIMNEPAFHRDGVFDKGVYVKRLRLIRTTPAAFENGIREDLLLNRMWRLISETAELSPRDTEILNSIKG